MKYPYYECFHYFHFLIYFQDFEEKQKRKRIKICFSKDVSSEKGFNSTAGDSQANSSNPNIREETEFSTSNFDSKSHAGTELTNVSDENTTSMADEVSKS